MPRYCNTKELEELWGMWITASNTPQLEVLRQTNVLWSKPSENYMSHCIATKNPVFFESHCGIVRNNMIKAAITSTMYDEDKNLEKSLATQGYYPDNPVNETWQKLVNMLFLICYGVATKFHPRTDEERKELAHDALMHALSKILRGKLKYTPGRAPVFNLVTTAVTRIMYTIKSKEIRQTRNKSKLTEAIINKTPLPNTRSIEVIKAGIGAIHTEHTY
jgi:hypothetical protein